jgi:hypothetical protein
MKNLQEQLLVVARTEGRASSFFPYCGFQVNPGAKDLVPRARERNDSNRAIFGRLAQRTAESLKYAVVQRIPLPGPVDGEGKDS